MSSRMHELQKVYFALRCSRDAAGFNWNAPLIAQLKKDRMYCNSQQSNVVFYTTYNEVMLLPHKSGFIIRVTDAFRVLFSPLVVGG